MNPLPILRLIVLCAVMPWHVAYSTKTTPKTYFTAENLATVERVERIKEQKAAASNAALSLMHQKETIEKSWSEIGPDNPAYEHQQLKLSRKQSREKKLELKNT